jgi:hypothetical protein
MSTFMKGVCASATLKSEVIASANGVDFALGALRKPSASPKCFPGQKRGLYFGVVRFGVKATVACRRWIHTSKMESKMSAMSSKFTCSSE